MATKDYRTLIRYFKHIFLSAVVDSAIIGIGYAAAFWVRDVITPLESGPGIVLIIIEIFVLIFIFYAFGIYQSLWSRTSGHGITKIINCVILSTGFIFTLDVFIDPRPLPLSIILLGNLLALGGFVAVRYRSRLISGASWRWQAVWNNKFPTSATRVLIVGAGQSGQEVALQLKHRTPDKRYYVVGFVDDDPEKLQMYVEGCQVLGNRENIAHLVIECEIDLIVLAVHNISGPDFRAILAECEKTKALIKVVPNTLALMGSNSHAPLLRDLQPEDLLGRNTIAQHEDVDLSAINDKVVLVTGAAGSIGSELARQLPAFNPAQIILLDCNESGLHDLVIELNAQFPQVDKVQFLGNITDRRAIHQVFEKYRPQVVFHAAAYKHVHILEKFPEEAVQVNIIGTRYMAETAQAFGVERFVLISTDKAVNPNGVMGASKRICEMMLRALGQRHENRTLFTSVRFGNVLGSRGSVVTTFDSQIERGGPLTITDPKMTRYFMTIPEAVNLVIHAACLTKGGETFLLKMGEKVHILDLAQRMIRMRGLRPNRDIEIKITGVRPGEKMEEQLYDGTAESVVETIHPGIIQLMVFNNNFDGRLLLEWVDHLEKNGLNCETSALHQLLWGMTPTEQYAIVGDTVECEPRPLTLTGHHTTAAD